ncbi:MAG: transcription initiation protein, partial [Burkholderiaceae bacterium]
MPRFITIGYGDRDGYDRTPKAVRDAAHAHDELLRQRGVLMGIAGSPVQVRNHKAEHVETKEGPYMASQLPIAGFAVIEASTLAEAVELVSKTPCAVAYGLVEVWPLEC